MRTPVKIVILFFNFSIFPYGRVSSIRAGTAQVHVQVRSQRPAHEGRQRPMGGAGRGRGAWRLQRGPAGRSDPEGDVHVGQTQRLQRTSPLRKPRTSSASSRWTSPPPPSRWPWTPKPLSGLCVDRLLRLYGIYRGTDSNKDYT